MKTKEATLAVKEYIIGFCGALILTLTAYFATVDKWFSNVYTLVVFILVLAALQFLLQVRYFLHLKEDPIPNWRKQSFIFTIAMMLIVVVGSIWVMLNMNYNMGMSGEEMNHYMIKENKKGF